jgi:hypothetical protein
MSYWKSEAEWIDWIEMGACVERERARERASEKERKRETAALRLSYYECSKHA